MTLPQISNYRLIKPIGEGGFAHVYLAVQRNTRRRVALKVVTSQPSADNSFATRFVREIRIASQLQHPNIVQIYDVKQEGDLCYCVMEYLPDGDLKQRFKRGLSLGDGLKILVKVLSTLEYANNLDFVHLGIKPENILFRNDVPLLSDFGFARSTLADGQATMTGTITGNPLYMSPEQALGIPSDKRTDLYSAGIILFELIAGKLPFYANSGISTAMRHITQPVPRLPRDMKDFQRLVDKALAKAPEKRFQTAAEFAEAILKLEVRLAKKPSVLAKICHSSTAKTKSKHSIGNSSLAKLKHYIRRNNASALVDRTAWLTPFSLGLILTLVVTLLVVVVGSAHLLLRQNPGKSVQAGKFLDEEARSLLVSAETAIAEAVETGSATDHAQAYLDRLLAIAPNNPEVIIHLENLTRIYVTKINAYIKTGTFIKARAVLMKATNNRANIESPKLIRQLNRLSFQISHHETSLRKEEQVRAKLAGIAGKAGP